MFSCSIACTYDGNFEIHHVYDRRLFETVCNRTTIWWFEKHGKVVIKNKNLANFNIQLLFQSQNISMAVYHSNWIDSSKGMRQNVLIMMRRSYKPFLIYVSGFIREISLMQYADVCFLFTFQKKHNDWYIQNRKTWKCMKCTKYLFCSFFILRCHISWDSEWFLCNFVSNYLIQLTNKKYFLYEIKKEYIIIFQKHFQFRWFVNCFYY